MMTNPELRKHLASRYACREAMEWLGDDRDSARMWAECDRPEWLLWYAAAHVSREELVLAACDCAETAMVHVPAGEDRPRLAIETARKWAVGEADMGCVKDAALAAKHASWKADDAESGTDASVSYAAGRAADNAASAADTPHAAASAAHAACTASTYAGTNSTAVASAARGAAANAKMCRLIRLRWPVCPEAK